MNGENDATRPGVSGTAQERPAPPELGDVHLQRVADGWKLYVQGALKCEGLTTKQALQLIRGEAGLLKKCAKMHTLLDIEALVEAPGMGRAG